jgi:MYXO-CTERM domain-containing protein
MRRIIIAFTLSLSFAPALALADEPPRKQEKSEKSKGCSIDDDGHTVLGLAALVLLVSAGALRRR